MPGGADHRAVIAHHDEALVGSQHQLCAIRRLGPPAAELAGATQVVGGVGELRITLEVNPFQGSGLVAVGESRHQQRFPLGRLYLA